MKCAELKMCLECDSIEEARIKSDLCGFDFDEKQYKEFKNLKTWKRTILLHRMDCRERNVISIL